MLTAKQLKWKRYYLANKARESQRSMQKRRRIVDAVKAFLNDYLTTHPCVDCGEPDPVVLEFDHRDPALKLFSMAEARRGKKRLAAVKEEVIKCDVRCVTCHRRRTARQVTAGELRPGYPIRATAI